MGLIKAITGAVGGVLADQWLEYIYCDSLDENTLVTKGKKKAGKRSSNTKGSDNIISNGSGIVVNEGQCMIIVEQGKVVELCAEPGSFTYNNTTEPSIFCGSLGENIKNTFKNIGKRFAFGGEPANDQRVYYFNTKEIMGNKYGTPNPVPFRVCDKNIGLDMDIAIKCFGEYSYKISDPMLFYTNVCGNVEEDYTRDRIDSQLKSELMTSLQPAFAKISEMGIRYSALPGHTTEIAQALDEILSDKWSKTRGISIASFGVSSVKAPEEDEKMIKELQRNATFRDPTMGAAHLVGAQAQAMRDAAKNEGNMGAMGGFFGMNMAQNSASNVQNLYAMGTQQNATAANDGQTTWKCACGKFNTGKFCSECGAKQPEIGWKCACGQLNNGKFCSECGKPKPRNFRCDKCGWEPENPDKLPKFCPECGDKFDENDVK